MTIAGDRPLRSAEDEDAEERLRFQAQLLEAIPDSVIFTDLKGRIQYWNRGAEALFGYTAAEMIGQTPAMLYPSTGDELLQEDLAGIMAGRDFSATWQGRRKDGAMVWLDVKTTLARDADGEPIGIIGVSKDATARKQAEEALMKSERLYRLISQASREALWEWELETGKVSWSPGAEAILGLDPETLETNGALLGRIHADDRRRVEEGLADAIAGGGVFWSDEYRVKRRDGSYATVADRAYIERGADGAAVRVVGAMADVTARKQAEEHYRRADRLDAVGRLAGGIAHDLNNMLTAILNSAAFVTKRLPADSSEVGELQRLSLAANRSAKLTQQLLAFARRDMIQPQMVDVNLAVTEAVHLLRPAAPAHHRSGAGAGAEAGAGHGRQVPAGPGGGEPGAQRARRHAAGRAGDPGDVVGAARPGVPGAPRPGEHQAGPLRDDRGERHRTRHGPGDAEPHLRAVLHHQARGPGHRTRPGDGVRLGEAGGRTGLGLQRAEYWDSDQGVPSELCHG